MKSLKIHLGNCGRAIET